LHNQFLKGKNYKGLRSFRLFLYFTGILEFAKDLKNKREKYLLSVLEEGDDQL